MRKTKVTLITKKGKSSKRGDRHNINYHSDDKDGELYRNMIGLCYQLRAMVYMRISQCYHELMLRVMDSTIYTAITTPSPEPSAGAGLFASGLSGNNNNNYQKNNNNNTNINDNRKIITTATSTTTIVIMTPVIWVKD